MYIGGSGVTSMLLGHTRLGIMTGLCSSEAMTLEYLARPICCAAEGIHKIRVDLGMILREFIEA